VLGPEVAQADRVRAVSPERNTVFIGFFLFPLIPAKAGTQIFGRTDATQA